MVLVHVAALVAAQGPARHAGERRQARRWLWRGVLLWLARRQRSGGSTCSRTDLPGGRLVVRRGADGADAGRRNGDLAAQYRDARPPRCARRSRGRRRPTAPAAAPRGPCPRAATSRAPAISAASAWPWASGNSGSSVPCSTRVGASISAIVCGGSSPPPTTSQWLVTLARTSRVRSTTLREMLPDPVLVEAERTGVQRGAPRPSGPRPRPGRPSRGRRPAARSWPRSVARAAAAVSGPPGRRRRWSRSGSG